ncbi:hypothetical protein SFRURICE_005541 [Spodoptera frugiperda]|nr:hypothetical protein SFRURICE_005541 [Spodoptera frugiperda]
MAVLTRGTLSSPLVTPKETIPTVTPLKKRGAPSSLVSRSRPMVLRSPVQIMFSVMVLLTTSSRPNTPADKLQLQSIRQVDTLAQNGSLGDSASQGHWGFQADDRDISIVGQQTEGWVQVGSGDLTDNTLRTTVGGTSSDAAVARSISPLTECGRKSARSQHRTAATAGLRGSPPAPGWGTPQSRLISPPLQMSRRDLEHIILKE